MRVPVALLVAVGAIAVPTLPLPASAKAGQRARGYPWQQPIHNALEFLHTRTGSATSTAAGSRQRRLAGPPGRPPGAGRALPPP